MSIAEALVIIADLAQGIDPIGGQTFPDGGPYQHPEVIQALSLAAAALEKAEQRQERGKALPPQAGRSWSHVEDQELCERFDQRIPVGQIARLHHRTTGAIQSRLARLGKITAPVYRQTR